MRAILRGIAVLLAGVIGLAPAPALAQDAQQSPTATATTSPSDAVGPRELQNFSLSGNVTKPSEQPAPPSAAGKPAAGPVTSTPASSGPPVARRIASTREHARPAPTTAPTRTAVAPPPAAAALSTSPEPAPVQAA